MLFRVYDKWVDGMLLIDAPETFDFKASVIIFEQDYGILPDRSEHWYELQDFIYIDDYWDIYRDSITRAEKMLKKDGFGDAYANDYNEDSCFGLLWYYGRWLERNYGLTPIKSKSMHGIFKHMS